MLFYLFVTHTQNIFLRAKERMNLTAELNFHLSRALLEFRSAAEVEDHDERLRMLDQATEYMDHVLIELVPTVSAEKPPAFQFPKRLVKRRKRLSGFRLKTGRARRVSKNWSMVAGGTATSFAFARTCSSRDMPTSAVVIPGEERTNCKARSASDRGQRFPDKFRKIAGHLALQEGSAGDQA